MRFRSGEAAVMSHILLHSLRPSDKPLCTDRYVNDQAICMLTSSQRGCVCTHKIYQLDAFPPLYKHMSWQQRGTPQGLWKCIGKTYQVQMGTCYMTQTSFHRVPSDFSPFAVPDSGVNHGKPALETFPCRPHPDTTPKTDTPSRFWSYNTSLLWMDNCIAYLERLHFKPRADSLNKH